MLLIVSLLKMAVFWEVVRCSLAETDRCFGVAYYLHHQGDIYLKGKVIVHCRDRGS